MNQLPNLKWPIIRPAEQYKRRSERTDAVLLTVATLAFVMYVVMLFAMAALGGGGD